MWSSFTVWVLVGLLSVGIAMDMEVSKTAFRSAIRTPRNVERKERQASYDCGKTYTSTTGTIQSENYPQDYSNNHECDWTIRAPPGNTIELTFADPYRIEIPSGGDCYADELEIFDGGSESPRTTAVCGKTKPSPITTTTNVVYLRFHSDSSLGFPGFQINYRFISGGGSGTDTSTGPIASSGQCGDTLTSPIGTIQSENYPDNYSNNYQCGWTIRAPPGQTIELTFVDTYRIEIPNSSGVCYADRLEIHDGGEENPPIKTVCGKTRPDPITTTTNVAYLKFESDYSLGFAGFRIAYRFLGGSGGGATGGGVVVPGQSITLGGGTCQFVITPGPGCNVVS